MRFVDDAGRRRFELPHTYIAG
jgi:hypothetical protein